MTISLRGKLALVALALLALPAVGVRLVNEMERVLLEGQERTLVATARAVATALHNRPRLLAKPAAKPDPITDVLRREAQEALQRRSEGRGPPPDTQAPIASESEIEESGGQEEITAILKAVERSSSRVWVVNRRYEVLALAGNLRRPAPKESRGVLFAAWEQAAGWLIRQPREDFADSVPDGVIATGREISSALMGAPGTRSRPTADGKAVVMSAAQPIWNGDEVVGAVVVEETTNPVLALRSAALEQLLILTLTAFAGVAAILIVFAFRLSARIRRLRDEAESAIDARGRITRLTSGTEAGDEIGDLSRSFSAMLGKLADHHGYLEALASRLSHELRTPVAVVRSSLENLKLAPSEAEARVYVARAEEGLARLNRILERMTEATRLEQSLASADRERFDLCEVVRGCVEGYRQAYPGAAFELEAPENLPLDGSPDLVAQMLDKLVENAVDYAEKGTPIRVTLQEGTSGAVLKVENRGPSIPEEIRGRLFQAMVSARAGEKTGAAHLGLGLYVARLIAEFHGGGIEALDREGGGVVMTVRLARGDTRGEKWKALAAPGSRT